MFKKEAQDLSLKPIPTIRSIKSMDFRAEKERLIFQYNREKLKHKQHRQTLALIRKEEAKLNDDYQRYISKVGKAKKRIEYMKNNLGNTQAFLQENQYINHLAEQIMIQNSVNQETGPNPDNMTYEELLELGDKIGKVSKGLSLKQMEMLKRIYYNKLKTKVDSKCTVCCEQYQGNDLLIQLKCRHCYHQQCIMGWLKQENICPLCKQSVVQQHM